MRRLPGRTRGQATGQGKVMLVHIVSMLAGLIKRTSPNRVYEASETYGVDAKMTGAGE